MATQFALNEISSHLDDIFARVRSGEEITIVDPNGPVARIVPINNDEADRKLGFGMLKGKIWIADDFNAPLSEAELQEWEK